MIYTAPCIMFYMRAYPLQGESGGGGAWNSRVFWALWNGIEPIDMPFLYCLPVCCMSAFLAACMHFWRPACLSVCVYVCLSAWLPACLPSCLPVCLPTCLSAWLPACLLAYLPASCHILLLFRLADFKEYRYRSVPYWCMPWRQKEGTTVLRLYKQAIC